MKMFNRRRIDLKHIPSFSGIEQNNLTQLKKTKS